MIADGTMEDIMRQYMEDLLGVEWIPRPNAMQWMLSTTDVTAIRLVSRPSNSSG